GAERGVGVAEGALLVGRPEVGGGRLVLAGAEGPVAAAVEGLRVLYDLLEQRGVAERVIFDLGLVRELGYYTGAVFEVYDPAVGFALGGGGRYDDLIGRFGRELPACGVALDVQRVHLAQAAEEALG
ncbi:MAG: ATP phosphoribosyltransferase regulatory subunit, partial [Thermoleophilaceae bacterium]